jgi:hypothetical protein
MGNHLAVAAVTRTLTHLLDGELAQDFAAAHALPGRPDVDATEGSGPQARIFLYRVEPNADWRSNVLPTRSPTGQEPQIGLTLQYLVTFVGNEALQEPQRMLGSVVRTLGARPVLARSEIEATVAAAVAEDPQSPLAMVDLMEQPELIRISLLPLTLDQLSALWSSFFHTPYRLSVAYEASVVLLTAGDNG